MDQIYIPKNRAGFEIGSYVTIRSLNNKNAERIERNKLYFYHVKSLEPIKLDIINNVIKVVDANISKYENIIITGSFLDEGFDFRDLDIIIVSDEKIESKNIEPILEKEIRLKLDIIVIDNNALMTGLSNDPLYQMMLSKCVTKNRFVYRIKKKMDYRILDLHLLESKSLINNFNILNGREKYYLIRNMIAIYLFLKGKKINQINVDNEIRKIFHLEDILEIKNNMLNKAKFLNRYKRLYNHIFNEIIGHVKDGSK